LSPLQFLQLLLPLDLLFSLLEGKFFLLLINDIVLVLLADAILCVLKAASYGLLHVLVGVTQADVIEKVLFSELL